MHIISQKALRDFWSEHAEAEQPMRRWHGIAKRADWADFASVRRDFPHADLVGALVVFNVGGNKFRVIAEFNYEGRKVFIRAVLTHHEYDKGDWKP